MKQEDIEFLKQLQKAIKEGKRCGQREPAFWMIQEKVTYGNDDPEGADETILINCEGDILKNSDLEDVKDSLEEDAEDCYCEDELKECKSIQDIISFMESNDIKSSKDGYVRLSYIHSYYRMKTLKSI